MHLTSAYAYSSFQRMGACAARAFYLLQLATIGARRSTLAAASYRDF